MALPLPVLLFLITLAVELTSWIGNAALIEFFYPLTSTFSFSPESKHRRALRTDILKLRAELAATSSQDEFAKWAKIRRKLDKAIADLETANASTASHKAAFSSYFKSIMWIATTVLPFIVSSYHRKAAVFYLPPNWFGPLTWYLGLPSAPMGAISCGLWTMACKRTITSVKDVIVDLVRGDQANATPTAIPVPAESIEKQQEEKVKDEL